MNLFQCFIQLSVCMFVIKKREKKEERMLFVMTKIRSENCAGHFLLSLDLSVSCYVCVSGFLSHTCTHTFTSVTCRFHHLETVLVFKLHFLHSSHQPQCDIKYFMCVCVVMLLTDHQLPLNLCLHKITCQFSGNFTRNCSII